MSENITEEGGHDDLWSRMMICVPNTTKVNCLITLIGGIIIGVGIKVIFPAIESLFTIGLSIESGTPFVLLIGGCDIAIGGWIFYKGLMREERNE